MSMQQSGKGASSGSGPNPALSDEQADQFASSFTPAWDADDGSGDGPNGNAGETLVDASAGAAIEAAAAIPPPAAAPVYNSKMTLIGTAPQANLPPAIDPMAQTIVNGSANTPAMRSAASSAEAIDPENILEANTAPPVDVRRDLAQTAPVKAARGTQIMERVPAPAQAQAQPQAQARRAPSNAPPAGQARQAPAPAKNAPKVTADPFRAGSSSSSSDLDDLVPRKSSKTPLFVVAGLAIAVGLGLFLKFALTDDAPKAPPEQHVTGPAVTTAEIPPPPPPSETPPATGTATAKVDTTPSAPVATPVAPVAPVAPRVDPPQGRTQPNQPASGAGAQGRTDPRPPRTTPAQSPPQAAAQPATAPASPKTPPKNPNVGIVRDNPF